MSDLRSILKEEYKKKEEVVTPQSLIEMIEETMRAFGGLSATSGGYTITEKVSEDPTMDQDEDGGVRVIRRPVIKITEKWGEKGSQDREIMEALMANIGGGTVEDKIQSVNSFLTEPVSAAGGDISKIMSYLIFLDTFASIISDYGASVSGFLFEAFLAALFGGRSIQVDDPEQVGAVGTLPIEDNQLFVQLKAQRESPNAEPDWDIVPYSLKVLRQDGVVHGSFKNLVDFFLDPAPKRKSDSIVYLVVIKEALKEKGGKLGKWTGKLKFYEFTITRETFLDLIGAPKQVPIFDYVSYTVPSKKKQSIGVAIMDDGKRKTLAQVRGMPFYQTENGDPWPEGEPIPGGTQVKRLEQVGAQEVASAKLFSPEEYERIRGEFTDAEVSRQVFAALKDTKGYGSKVAGGAQWSITPGVYRNLKNPDGSSSYKGELNLDPTMLKGKAEEYTQTLNAGIVSIFNALGALSDNINSYFIGGNKGAGELAIKDTKTLGDAVNEVIPTEAIEQKPQ